MLMHPFSDQLREDFHRLAKEYLERYSEPALWFPMRTELPHSLVDASAVVDLDRVGTGGSYLTVRVLAILPNDFHIQRYGITPEGTGICFADFEMRVDDVLVLPERMMPRETWAKPKRVEAITQRIFFAVPSFHPLAGTWEQGELVRYDIRTLYGKYATPVNTQERYLIRYEFAYTLRVKSMAASWRVAGMDRPVFSYHVSLQDE